MADQCTAKNNKEKDLVRGVICYLNKSVLADVNDCDCNSQKHIHYSVSNQQFLINSGDSFTVQFPETYRQASSPLGLLSIENKKINLDNPFMALIETPDDISELECPENLSCKHIYLHSEDTIFHTIYVSFMPAPSLSGHKGMWWVVEIAVHQIEYNNIGIDKTCRDLTCKRSTHDDDEDEDEDKDNEDA
jgi:hypothetical protein